MNKMRSTFGKEKAFAPFITRGNLWLSGREDRVSAVIARYRGEDLYE